MLRDASNAIKRHAPVVHDFIKRVYHRSGLPSVKLLNGSLVLVAPKLIGASPTEPHVLRWIHALLRPGDTFFDVGSHHGWMSVVACHRVGAKGKVVAFEPSPPLVECLEYNRRANRLHQMQIVPKAVADSAARIVPFYLVNQGDSFLNTLLDHRTAPVRIDQTTAIEVETICLDDFCEETKLHPNAVKIDIEGAELGLSVFAVHKFATTLARERPYSSHYLLAPSLHGETYNPSVLLFRCTAVFLFDNSQWSLARHPLKTSSTT